MLFYGIRRCGFRHVVSHRDIKVDKTKVGYRALGLPTCVKGREASLDMQVSAATISSMIFLKPLKPLTLLLAKETRLFLLISVLKHFT